MPRPKSVEVMPVWEKIFAYMREEPRRFSMETWLTNMAPTWNHVNPFLPACNTVACLAGTAVLVTNGNQAALSKDYTIPDGMAVAARKILLLTQDEGDRLFYVPNWPDPYSSDYEEADYKLDDLYYDSRQDPNEELVKTIIRLAAERVEISIKRFEFFLESGI